MIAELDFWIGSSKSGSFSKPSFFEELEKFMMNFPAEQPFCI